MIDYKIYPSLLDSFFWFQRIEARTEQEIIDKINKVEVVLPDHVHKGSAFDELTEDPSLLETDKVELTDATVGYDGYTFPRRIVNEVMMIRKGGTHQVYVEKIIQIGGVNVLLYGYVDTGKNGEALEIKTITKGYKPPKYEGSAQWPVYLYCGDFRKLTYVITDFKEINFEPYYQYRDLIQTKLNDMLMNFINFIELDRIKEQIINTKIYGR